MYACMYVNRIPSSPLEPLVLASCVGMYACMYACLYICMDVCKAGEHRIPTGPPEPLVLAFCADASCTSVLCGYAYKWSYSRIQNPCALCTYIRTHKHIRVLSMKNDTCHDLLQRLSNVCTYVHKNWCVVRKIIYMYGPQVELRTQAYFGQVDLGCKNIHKKWSK
jgi:hypothetical protein